MSQTFPTSPRIIALADSLIEELKAEGMKDFVFLGLRRDADGTASLWSKAASGAVELGNMLAYLLATLTTNDTITQVLQLLATHPMIVARLGAPANKQQPAEEPKPAVEIKTEWVN